MFRLFEIFHSVQKAPGMSPAGNRSNTATVYLTLSALPFKCPQPAFYVLKRKC